MAYENIELDVSPEGTAVVLLNRPHKRNAFNAQVIEELSDAFETISKNPQCRLVLVRGAGPVFSAGADLEWRFADGWRLDGEFLIDELATESASQPDRIGLQGGVSWSGGFLGRSADARIEGTKVYRDTYAVFYGANFLQDDIPLGYDRGPDVEHALAYLDVNVSTDLRFGLGMEAQRHGEGRPGDFWDPEDPESQNSGADLEGVIERVLFLAAEDNLNYEGVLRIVDLAKSGVDDLKIEFLTTH